MVRSPLARILLCLGVLALIGVSALALGNRNGIVTTSDGRHVIATKGPSKITPNDPNSDSGLTRIAGNLNYFFPYGTYFCCYGNTIAGPNAGFGHTYWAAMGFTPAADATVNKIRASVGFVTGVNQIVLGLYADSNGIPGKPLFKAETSRALGTFGDCCVLAVVNDTAGVSVRAGTPYWVVVSTDSKSATTFAAWAFNSTDMRQNVNRVSYYVDGTWNSGTSLQAGYSVLSNN